MNRQRVRDECWPIRYFGSRWLGRNAPAVLPGEKRMNADPIPDLAECERFIRFWFEVTETLHVTLVAILPDSQSVHAKTFTDGALEAACNWIADHQRSGRNIYFQPNETPFDCARKPRKADMVAATCRFADIDPDDEHYPLVDERHRLIQLAEHLSNAPTIAPTVIIDSGNGIQPIWVVTREPLDEVVLARVEAENREIETALGAGGTHNIDRLLRLPGTVNFPNATKRNRGRGVSRARLTFAAPTVYQSEEAATLATHLTELLAGMGLVRAKPVKAAKATTVTDENADVAALMHQLQEAGAGKITQLDHLSPDLQSRLNKAIAMRRRLAARWAGNVEDLVKTGRDNSRSGADLSLAAMLKAAGFSHLDAGLILCAFPHGKANNEEWANPGLRLRHVARSVLHSYEPSSDSVATIIEEFNRRYMVVNEAGKAVIYAPAYDPILQRRRFDRSTFDDLRRLHMNRLVKIGHDASGSPIFKDAANIWLEHPDRRQYIDGVTFDPSGSSEPGVLNLWQGFAVIPVQGDWSLMKRHIWEVICNGDPIRYHYLISWLARLVQHPAEQGEVAVVMKGGEGTGKGTLAKAVLHLLGQHGIAISNARHLVGNFNGHMRDCVFLFADEAFFAGDKQHVGVLKSSITEPYLTIEAKYQNAVQTPNFLHVMMASNEEWVVPAGLDARRFLVLVISEHRKGDHAYFGAILEQMEAGGYAAMLYDLLNHDITNFNARAVPVTDGLQQQKKLNLPVPEAWWLDVLHRGYVYRSRLGLEEYFGDWHDELATEVLYASYIAYAQQARERHLLTREHFGKKIVSFGAKSTRLRNAVVGEHIADVKNDFGTTTRKAELIRHPRPPGYHLGILQESRKAFVAKTGLEIDWQDSGDHTEDADGFESSVATPHDQKWRVRL
jgi:hypothetical protein